jgi:CheY-like chemotaxis protein
MSSPPIQLGRLQILCVDDSESKLWVRTKVLEKAGYALLTATSALKAVYLLRENAVRLIVSDHMLSGKQGTEFAGKLKKLKPNVPLVAYASAPPEHMQNVDCFINKDEPVHKFLSIVRDLIKRYSQ